MSMVGFALIYQERNGYWCLVPPLGALWARSWYQTQGQAQGQARCFGWQVAGEDEVPLPEQEPQEQPQEAAVA